MVLFLLVGSQERFGALLFGVPRRTIAILTMGTMKEGAVRKRTSQRAPWSAE